MKRECNARSDAGASATVLMRRLSQKDLTQICADSIGQVPSDSHCRHRKLRRLSQKDLTQICANNLTPTNVMGNHPPARRHATESTPLFFYACDTICRKSRSSLAKASLTSSSSERSTTTCAQATNAKSKRNQKQKARRALHATASV